VPVDYLHRILREKLEHDVFTMQVQHIQPFIGDTLKHKSTAARGYISWEPAGSGMFTGVKIPSQYAQQLQ
jgi:hypothetical protein